jgi:hypothetical protein
VKALDRYDNKASVEIVAGEVWHECNYPIKECPIGLRIRYEHETGMFYARCYSQGLSSVNTFDVLVAHIVIGEDDRPDGYGLTMFNPTHSEMTYERVSKAIRKLTGMAAFLEHCKHFMPKQPIALLGDGRIYQGKNVLKRLALVRTDLPGSADLLWDDSTRVEFAYVPKQFRGREVYKSKRDRRLSEQPREVKKLSFDPKKLYR